MIIRKNEDTVALQGETCLVFRKVNFDGFTLETSDYEGTISFTITESEKDIHELLMVFIQDVITNYMKTEACPMMSLSWNKIELRSDSDVDNRVTILHDKASGDITLTFVKDPKSFYSNNRVILDKDGNLSYGFYVPFQTLYEGLRNVPSKDPSVLGRIRALLTRPKR